MIRLSGFADEMAETVDKQIDVLKRLNMKYASVRSVEGKRIEGYSVREFSQLVWNRMKSAGIRISSFGSMIGKIPVNDDEAYHVQLSQLENLCNMCEVSSCRYIRMFSFFIPENSHPDLYLEQVIDKLTGYLKIAEKHGVTLIHENEKDIYGNTALRCRNLFDIIDSSSFRGVFDPGGFVQCGDDVMNSWEILKKDILSFHIKDSLYSNRQNVLCGTGDACMKELLSKAVLEDHFDGFLTLEPHLVIFIGLGIQEKNSVDKIIEKNRAGDIESGFVMQYNALQEILKEIQGRKNGGR